jgi:hypothetical protein
MAWITGDSGFVALKLAGKMWAAVIFDLNFDVIERVCYDIPE